MGEILISGMKAVKILQEANVSESSYLLKQINLVNLNVFNYIKGDHLELIKKLYSKELLLDAIDSDYIDIKTGDTIEKLNRQSVEVVAGFIFESFITRKINESSNIKRNIIKWITDSERRLSEKEADKYHAIAVGSKRIRNIFPQFYKPLDPSIDIMFVNKDGEPLLNRRGYYAYLQIKAITSNYKEQIIENIKNIDGYVQPGNHYFLGPPKYDKVLTLLKDKNGIHSYQLCIEILKKEHSQGLISSQHYVSCEQRIQFPEAFGFNQNEIDNYYELIKYWYFNPNEFRLEQLDINFQNGLILSDLVKQDELNIRISNHQHLILTT